VLFYAPASRAGLPPELLSGKAARLDLHDTTGSRSGYQNNYRAPLPHSSGTHKRTSGAMRPSRQGRLSTPKGGESVFQSFFEFVSSLLALISGGFLTVGN
jgi:hypothetical protein